MNEMKFSGWQIEVTKIEVKLSYRKQTFLAHLSLVTDIHICCTSVICLIILWLHLGFFFFLLQVNKKVNPPF